MPFFPSWKALFEQLAKDSPNLQDFSGYSRLLVRNHPMETCKQHLTATPHCAVLTICSGHVVKIIHHFHHDVNTPVVPAGTDKLWALIGPGTTASPISLPDATFNNCKSLTLAFEDIIEATTLEDLGKVAMPNSTAVKNYPELKYKGKNCIAVPPFLMKILMDADTEDAFQLLCMCCKALADFDNHDPVMVAHHSDTESDDKESEATDVFFRLVQFLYLVATKKIPEPYNLNLLTTSHPQDWAAHVKDANGVAVMGGTGGASPDEVALRLGTTLDQFCQELKESNNLQRAKAEKEKKSKSSKDKLLEHSLRMILNASEPIQDDLMDENGDPITAHQDVIPMYGKLLSCSSIGMVREHLEHYLNVKKQCECVVPLSTCAAIYMGKLRWSSLDHPEAFSILACYHLALDSAPTVGEDGLAMHLCTTEGMGLTDTDVAKATKVVLFPPNSIDVLAKQFGVFGCLCGTWSGEQSDLQMEMDDWVAHMLKYETTYHSLQHANPCFTTELACFVDHRVQLYLRDCAEAQSSNDVSSTMLSFTDTKQQILDGTFAAKLIPCSLLEKLEAKKPARDARATCDHDDVEEEPRRHLGQRNKKKEKKVVNHKLNKKWKVPSTDAIGFFVNRLASEGIRFNRKPICFHFHSVGECTENCRFAATHTELTEQPRKQYNSFFTKTL